jgi:hypothetical protein
MRRKTKDETLVDCLSYLSMRTLPEKWDKKAFYIMAIVEVEKADGTVCYAIQKRRASNLELYISNDFGSLAVIRNIKEIYPFEFLKEQYMFDGKKEDKIKFLKSRFPKENIDELDAKEIKRLILRAAMETQIQQENL